MNPHSGRRRLAATLITSLAATLALIAGPAQAQRKPISLAQASIIGKAMFPTGDTAQGGHGQTIDKIEGSSQEMLKVHVHAHLSLFYQGQQIAVPAGVGIVPPFQQQSGFIGGGSAIYWLHTHDATGIIHVESPDDRHYTLGNFFDIWGMPLDTGDIAGMKGKVHAYINGQEYNGKLRDIPLVAHTQITLVVGEPLVTPPSYVFPEGL
jgi:hypothetical protein